MRLAASMLVLAACGALWSCAAIPVATLAAAGSAVQSGSSVWRSGILSTAQLAPFDRTVDAVEAAVAELGLRLRTRSTRAGHDALSLVDDHHNRMRITVKHRTDAYTTIVIDMGIFGSQAVARLIQERIEHHLAHPGAAGGAEPLEGGSR